MIYYNQERLPLFFATKDGVVFEVNSNKKPEELLEIMLKGEDISEISNITTYLVIDPGVSKFDPKNLFETYKVRETGNTKIPNYNMSYNVDYDGDNDNYVPKRTEKPFMTIRENLIFSNFEATTFGPTDTAIKFHVLSSDYFNDHASAKAAFRNVFIKQLAASCDIAPVLLEYYPDAEISEYKRLSKLAESTYDDVIAEFYSDGHNDGVDTWLPSKEAMDVLKVMTKAEKSLLDTDAGLPVYEMSVTKITDLILKAKADKGSNKYLVTLDDIKKIHVGQNQGENQRFQTFKTDLTAAFQEKFNFVPRVIDDYALAQYLINPTNPKTPQEIVDTFNRGSLSKVAAYKNIALFALCNELNFNEVKAEHIDIIGVFYPQNELSKLPEFIAYYKKYKDSLSEEQLKSICQYIREYDIVMGLYTPYGRHTTHRQAGSMLDLDKTPGEIIEYYNKAYAVSQKNLFEERYGRELSQNDLAIKGRNIEVTNGVYTMKMLQKDDLDLFVTGRDTNCCTEFDSPGESCVYKAMSDPLHTFCAIYSKTGRMIVSAYTWVDLTTDTLVFDNMEFHNDAKVASFEPVIAAFVKALPYKNVHVGTGYNREMSGWGKKVTYGATMPKIIDPSNHVYSDYSQSTARSLKTDGTLTIKDHSNIQVELKELIPSDFDEVIESGLGYLLGLGKPLNELRELGRKIANNELSDDEVKELITKISPSNELMETLPALSETVQMWFADRYPDKLSLIKSPCDAIAIRLIQNDPKLIGSIENPSENLLKQVVRTNGLYLGQIKSNITYDVCKEAVNQNGYAYQLVPAEFKTTELKEIAISKAPRSILSMEEIPNDLLVLAFNADPGLATLIESTKGPLPEEVQVNIARREPSAVLGLEFPAFEAMRVAVEQNGMYIRNCYNRFPELIEVAVRQNPKAISVIPHPTVEVARIAVAIDNTAINYIKDQSVVEALNNEEYEEDLSLD